MTEQEDIISRIKGIYHSMQDDEKQILRKILEEFASTGRSTTYEDVWLADYKEIPVSKKVFLTSPRYLGNTNDNGRSIYPAWMDVMLELERTGNQYTEIVLTGATRTGKSTTAVSDASYQLYRLMCLRDPHAYFNIKTTTTLSIFFFNLTKDLARGVCFKEFNTTLKMSPWFQEHGHMTNSETNPIYIPEGGNIEISYGSDSSHALGRATFCVVGDTEIWTASGYQKISELSGHVDVYQIDDKGHIVLAGAEVFCTGYADETIRIMLEDGSCLEGTPDHKVLLVDGTYKKLKDIAEGDDIYSIGGLDEYQESRS